MGTGSHSGRPPRRDTRTDVPHRRQLLDLVRPRRTDLLRAPDARGHAGAHLALRPGALLRRPPLPTDRGPYRDAEPALAFPLDGDPARRSAAPLRGGLQPRVVRRHPPPQPPAVGDEV